MLITLIVISFIVLVFISFWMKTPVRKGAVFTKAQINKDVEIVTIAQFNDCMMANLAKIKLESEDIECFLDNENIIIMNWFYWNTVGGVKLQVKISDAQKALDILNTKVTPTETEQKAMHSTRGIHCLKCNSIMVYPNRIHWREAFFAVFLLGFPILFRNKEWECRECGHRWGYKKVNPESLKNIKFWDGLLFVVDVLGILSFITLFLVTTQKAVRLRYEENYGFWFFSYILMSIPNWIYFIMFAAILGFYVVKRHDIKDVLKRLRIDLIVFAFLIGCLIIIFATIERY
ncbi:MAG: hypothetical protein V1871_07055 [Planctomycetota bacterium]